jgi:hypothetical protein
MNKVKFVPINYWNKEIMGLGDSPTPEQWAEVEAIAKKLNDKYIGDNVCELHPDKVQKVVIGLFNKWVDIQIVPSDTCGCYNAMSKLAALRNYESLMLNDGRLYSRE